MKMRDKFEIEQLSTTQFLVDRRKRLLISQVEMAYRLNVSLKTIQNFENYKSLNSAYLVWGYKQIVNG